MEQYTEREDTRENLTKKIRHALEEFDRKAPERLRRIQNVKAAAIDLVGYLYGERSS